MLSLISCLLAAVVTQDLGGTWTLTGADAKEAPVRCPIAVPGDVHSALRAANLLEDPFWGANETNVQWVGLRDWTLTRSFDADAALLAHRGVILRMEDSDTFADVSVNGRLVGKTADRFCRWDFDVKPYLKAGANEIKLVYRSAWKEADRLMAASARPFFMSCDQPFACKTPVFIRKPACHRGWDWGLSQMVTGPCGAVKLIASDGDRVDYVACDQAFNADYSHCTLTVRATLETGAVVTNVVEIDRPPLWWPNGAGERKFYEYSVPVAGRRLKGRIGLRKLEIDTTRGALAVKVNGRALFMKGANWIPCSAYDSEQTPARYRDLLESAAAANMNMIRVWGGGQYEKDAFYDLCDELGLLIWHDQMFSCAVYPDTPEFLGQVKAECTHQFRRLRDHASIALWCGDNECVGALNWRLFSKTNAYYRAALEKRFAIISDAVKACDPSRMFWPSSPCAGPGSYADNWKNDSAGDMHNWQVWHANKPFDDYRLYRPRFCSEFGYQSFSSREVAETFCRPEDVHSGHPDFEWHQKNLGGNDRIRKSFARVFREPKDMDATLYLSQVQQALAIKTAVEGWRVERPRCMGTLIWQLNDLWPVASWSSIEYGGKWKHLHYHAKRFFAPVAVVALGSVSNKTVLAERGKIYAFNDTAKPRKGKLTVERWTYDGRKLDSRTTTETIWPDSVRDFGAFEKPERSGTSQFLVFKLETADGTFQNDYHFAPYRDLPIEPAGLASKWSEKGGAFELEITAARPAFFVWANVRGLRGEFSDNSFTVLPGEPVRLVFTPKQAGVTLRAIEAAFSLTSLSDSYVDLSLVPAPRAVRLGAGTAAADRVTDRTDASLPKEGYRLVVDGDGATVYASDAAGRFYARQTLAQLPRPWPQLTIEDEPAYSWRGVHLDEARHFFGKATVKKLLDLMAMHKLNKLHWHLTDDQGWRLPIPGYPEIEKIATVRSADQRDGVNAEEPEEAAKPENNDGKPYGPYFYTEADLREIVAYAAARQITVVPEIDLPGHIYAALAAYPEFACRPENLAKRDPRLAWGVSKDVLCVGNDRAVKFVEDVIDYVMEIFPSREIHLGGDECPSVRWQACPKCQARMKAEKLTDVQELEAWVLGRLSRRLEAKGRRAIFWNDALRHPRLLGNPVAMCWISGSTVEEMTRIATAGAAHAGYDVIATPYTSTYLNYSQGLKDDPLSYRPGPSLTLEKCHAFNPARGVPAACRSRILGSEICNWTATTRGEGPLFHKIWPRAAALAESFWCGDRKPPFEDFVGRMKRRHDKRLADAAVACLPSTPQPPDLRFEPASKYWNVEELTKVPKFRPANFPESEAPNMKQLLVTGKGPYDTEAEFFCYYALPSTPKPPKGYPCVLWVHGGGGTCYPEFIEHWRTNGFAVLALDWYNQHPVLEGLKEKGRRDLKGGKRNDQVANVANMVLANSLLRSMPEVNPEKNVFAGLSWGSWYGAAVAALDDRFKGFVEIYCGDQEHPLNQSRLVNGRFLNQAKRPMWWVTWTQDQNVTPMTSQAGWNACPTYWGHMTTTTLGHSHLGFLLPSVMRMAKYFAGEGPALPRLDRPWSPGADGVLRAEILPDTLPLPATNSASWASLHPYLVYTTDLSHSAPHLEREKRKWQIVPARIEGTFVAATVPRGTAIAYLTLNEKPEPTSDLGGASHYWFCPTTPDTETCSWAKYDKRQPPVLRRGYGVSYAIEFPELVAKTWERTAVTELTDYLLKLATNGVVKVGGEDAVFHVGDTDFARAHKLGAVDLKEEEWVVKSFGKDVVLSGGGRRGTLYAVWHFLEDTCGVRFWNDDDEDVPVAGELNLPAQDRCGKPFFMCRDVFRAGNASRWAEARRRINGASAAPMPAELGGACTYGPPYHCHTFREYLKFEKYGKEHPDWFAIFQGKRTGGGNFGGQPCLTHPEVRQWFIDRVEEYIAKGEAEAKKKNLPTPLMYDLSQNDSGKFCECDRCRAAEEKLGRSGLVLDFVKDISRAAAAKHPELYFSTLAYSSSQALPKENMNIPDNFIIKLCNTRQNLAADLSHEKNQKWCDLVKGWGAISKHLFIWEYVPTYGDNGKFGQGMPVPNEFYMAEKYRFYADHHVTGFLVEQERMKGYETQDMYELKFWVLSHLLEDPYQDGDKLIVEFIEGYYGKAAGAKVLAARRYLEKIARERKADVRWFPYASDFDFIKPEDVKLMQGLFEEAATLVKDDPKRSKRVAVARSSVEKLNKFMSAGGGLHPAEAGVSDVPFYELPVDESGFTLWKPAVFWQDPDIGDPAAGGANVVRIPVGAENETLHLPFIIGVYNQSIKKGVKSLKFKEAKGERYEWYELPNVDLPEGGSYVYLTRSWGVQEYLTSSDLKNKKVNIRALVKFQGPRFIPGSTLPDEIRIARVIFVPVK